MDGVTIANVCSDGTHAQARPLPAGLWWTGDARASHRGATVGHSVFAQLLSTADGMFLAFCPTIVKPENMYGMSFPDQTGWCHHSERAFLSLCT
eukprot:6204015-Pleurochrysis_carterae.AAC.8